MEKSELYAVLGVCFSMIATLSGLAYASVIDRINRNEKQREDDMDKVWGAIDETREDIKKLMATVVTKDDLTRSEDRVIKALRPAAGTAD